MRGGRVEVRFEGGGEGREEERREETLLSGAERGSVLFLGAPFRIPLRSSLKSWGAGSLAYPIQNSSSPTAAPTVMTRACQRMPPWVKRCPISGSMSV